MEDRVGDGPAELGVAEEAARAERAGDPEPRLAPAGDGEAAPVRPGPVEAHARRRAEEGRARREQRRRGAREAAGDEVLRGARLGEGPGDVVAVADVVVRGAEDRIAAARRLYNIEVRGLNRRCEAFPSNLVASTFGFSRAEYFELTDPGAAATPVVEV